MLGGELLGREGEEIREWYRQREPGGIGSQRWNVQGRGNQRVMDADIARGGEIRATGYEG